MPSSERTQTFLGITCTGRPKDKREQLSENKCCQSPWGGYRSGKVMEGKIAWKSLSLQITTAAFFISCSLFHNGTFLETPGEKLATHASHLCQRFNVCLMERVQMVQKEMELSGGKWLLPYAGALSISQLSAFAD